MQITNKNVLFINILVFKHNLYLYSYIFLHSQKLSNFLQNKKVLLTLDTLYNSIILKINLKLLLQ